MVTESLKNKEVKFEYSNENHPQLCVGIVFNQGGTPISLYGFEDTFNVCLLAGFTYAVKSISKYLSSSLPSMKFEEGKKIQNNFLNSGFYFCQFKNQHDDKYYGFITRPVDNDLFSENWINYILIQLVNQLENSENVVESSIDMFNVFNKYLKDEIKFINLIRNYEWKVNKKIELVFRKSGVYAGTLNNIIVKRIYQFILSGLKIDSNTEFLICGKNFCVEKKKFGYLEYFMLHEKNGVV